MWPRLLTALTVFITGLSTATSSSDRQDPPELLVTDKAAAPTQHQQAACRNCHWQVDPVGSTDHDGASNTNQCRSCHIDVASERGSLSEHFHRQVDKECTQCHSFHETAKLNANERQFASPADDGVRYQCRSCHNPNGSQTNLSEAHQVAAVKFYHADNRMRIDQSPSQSCLACHAGGAHAGLRFDGSRPAIAINTSASHPNEREVTSSPNRSFRNPIDSRIRLFENKIQCQSCHSLTSGIEHSLVKFASSYDLCLGCHDQSGRTLASGP